MMKKTIIFVLILLLPALTSCNNLTVIDVQTTNDKAVITSPDNGLPEALNNYGSALSEKNNPSLINGKYDTFHINNAMYINNSGRLYELDFVSGKIVPVCGDVLCTHHIPSCVMFPYFYSVTLSGDKIYVYGTTDDAEIVGSVFGARTAITFLGELNIITGKITYFDKWQETLGSKCSVISVENGIIYYAKNDSETSNAIYSYDTQTGKIEKISNEEDFIYQISVKDNMLYYRTGSWKLKKARLDFSEIETVAEKVSTFFFVGDELYCFDISNDNSHGFSLYRYSDNQLLLSGVRNPVTTLLEDTTIFYTAVNTDTDEQVYFDQNIYSFDIKSNETKKYAYNRVCSGIDILSVHDNYALVREKYTDKEAVYFLYDLVSSIGYEIPIESVEIRGD